MRLTLTVCPKTANFINMTSVGKRPEGRTLIVHVKELRGS